MCSPRKVARGARAAQAFPPQYDPQFGTLLPISNLAAEKQQHFSPLDPKVGDKIGSNSQKEGPGGIYDLRQMNTS